MPSFSLHPHKAHYITYCANYIVYGMIITGLGPLIPFFSANTGIIETEYSFLFSCRSFGMLLGAIFLKLLHKYTNVTYHKSLAIMSLTLVFTSTLFSYATSLFLQGIWMILSAVAYSAMEI